MSNRRTKRWNEVCGELSEWWGTNAWTKHQSLSKGVDSILAWQVYRDLRSIHLNEYRLDEDAEVREAMKDARRAALRLSGLLSKRAQRERVRRVRS